MAKVKKNLLIQGLSGTLGKDYVCRQMKDGRTIISRKPDFSNRQFSKDQLGQQGLLKQAAAYAKVASRTNPIYAQKAEGTPKNAYNIAVSDWFKPPVIQGIEQWERHIRVDAQDNVLVTQVIVTILDAEGQVLEQGQAQLVNGVWWEYELVNRGKIRVEAWDMAGNRVQEEF